MVCLYEELISWVVRCREVQLADSLSGCGLNGLDCTFISLLIIPKSKFVISGSDILGPVG